MVKGNQLDYLFSVSVKSARERQREKAGDGTLEMKVRHFTFVSAVVIRCILPRNWFLSSGETDEPCTIPHKYIYI